MSPVCLGGNVFGWTADERQSFAVLDADHEGLSRANIRTAVGESRDVLVLVGHVLGGETCGPQE